jgi:preprotein translocase subunit SecG
MNIQNGGASWVERHINWSLALAWLLISVLGLLLLIVLQNETGETLFAVFSSLAILGLLTGVWALLAKGQSLSWIFFLLVPLGFLVFFILGNNRAPNPAASTDSSA